MERIVVDPAEQGKSDLRTTMQDAMGKLEAKNAELGNKLFGVFGGATPKFSIADQVFSTRCLIFKTPLTKESPDGADEFLVVTEEGFKLIQVDKGGSLGEGRASFKDLLVEHIEFTQTHQQQPDEERRYGIDYRYDSGYARRDGIVLPPSPRTVKLGLHYTGKNLIGWQSTFHAGKELNSVRLVDRIDPDTVLEIIRMNIERDGQERVEEAREAEEKKGRQARVDEMLNRADPSLIVAQRLDEVLG